MLNKYLIIIIHFFSINLKASTPPVINNTYSNQKIIQNLEKNLKKWSNILGVNFSYDRNILELNKNSSAYMDLVIGEAITRLDKLVMVLNNTQMGKQVIRRLNASKAQVQLSRLPIGVNMIYQPIPKFIYINTLSASSDSLPFLVFAFSEEVSHASIDLSYLVEEVVAKLNSHQKRFWSSVKLNSRQNFFL